MAKITGNANDKWSLYLLHAPLLIFISMAIWLSAYTRIQLETISQAEVLADGRCTYDLIRSCSKDAAWTNVEDQPLQNNSTIAIETPLFELALPCCELPRFTQGTRDAKTCLHGRHVVLVGDSVTRYMYLNLVNYFELGAWIGPAPLSEVEKRWSDWLSFYEGTNARLNGNEICDCYRGQRKGMDTILENRYYFNRQYSFRVSYVALGKHEWGMKGHNLTWLEGSSDSDGQQPIEGPAMLPTSRMGQKGCPVGKCSADDYPLHWQQGIVEALEGHVAGLEPDVLVINSGLWEPLPGKVNITQFAAAGRRAVAEKQGKVFFKTTTRTYNGGKDVDDTVVSRILEHYGWRILDASSLTAPLPQKEKEHRHQFYWDDLHFFPQVYAGLNQVLLSAICS